MKRIAMQKSNQIFNKNLPIHYEIFSIYGIMYPKLSPAALGTDKSSLSAIPAARRHRDDLLLSRNLYGIINADKVENGNNRFLLLCIFYRSGSKPIDGLHLWYNKYKSSVPAE